MKLIFSLLMVIGLVKVCNTQFLDFSPSPVLDLKPISAFDVEPAYFAPWATNLNCDLKAFSDSMNAVANRLQMPAVWIYRTCIAESSLSPAIVNEVGATGLIQFMPQTAKGLGTSTKAIRAMSAIEQLQYVEKFYKPATNKIYTYAEFRLYAFFPAALKWTDDRVLESLEASAEEVARRNPSHDLNKDGRITKEEYLKSVGHVFAS